MAEGGYQGKPFEAFAENTQMLISNQQRVSTWPSGGLDADILKGTDVLIAHPLFTVARIENTFRDGSGMWCILVRWYYGPQDLSHPPPSLPQEGEVYYTDHIECMLRDSVVGFCSVTKKSDFLRLNTTDSGNNQGASTAAYFWEFEYETKKGTFISATSSRKESQGGGGGCASAELRDAKLISPAKELSQILLHMEICFPRNKLGGGWANCRQAWIRKTMNAKTIKELTQSLVELEEGLHILTAHSKSLSTKSYTAWKKTLSTIHTYDALAKYVNQYREDLELRKSIFRDNAGEVNYHQKPIEGNHLELRPTKFQRVDDMQIICTTGAFNSTTGSEIIVGGLYNIDQEVLAGSNIPVSLNFVRTVMVQERKENKVIVAYPSLLSLQSYFGRSPAAATSSVDDQLGKETTIGTNPDFTEYFVLTQEVAEKALFRFIPGAEFLHQGHLWSFWVVQDLENVQAKALSSEIASIEAISGLESNVEEVNGELKAAEALIQLIPDTNMTGSFEEKYPGKDGAQDHVLEGPLGYRVKKRTRSRRRGSLTFCHTNASSSINSDTGTWKRTERPHTRQSSDQHDECGHDAGPSTVTHDFMKVGESKRVLHLPFNVPDASSLKDADTTQWRDPKVHSLHNILKVSKDMKGRWTAERYESAQLKLLQIMHHKNAVPGNPILRSELREEARKKIGDTGLLDHLLKHMTDTVVSNGERFRRRHNTSGAMEYWLEDANFKAWRLAAGIKDEYWIPPVGWRPGDEISGRAEYASGMLNRRTTLAEALAMQELKDRVENFTSDLCANALSDLGKNLPNEAASPGSENAGFQEMRIRRILNIEYQNSKESGTKKTLRQMPHRKLEEDLLEIRQSLASSQDCIKRIIENLIREIAGVQRGETEQQTELSIALPGSGGHPSFNPTPEDTPQPTGKRPSCVSVGDGLQSSATTSKTNDRLAMLSRVASFEPVEEALTASFAQESPKNVFSPGINGIAASTRVNSGGSLVDSPHKSMTEILLQHRKTFDSTSHSSDVLVASEMVGSHLKTQHPTLLATRHMDALEPLKSLPWEASRKAVLLSLTSPGSTCSSSKPVSDPEPSPLISPLLACPSTNYSEGDESHSPICPGLGEQNLFPILETSSLDAADDISPTRTSKRRSPQPDALFYPQD